MPVLVAYTASGQRIESSTSAHPPPRPTPRPSTPQPSADAESPQHTQEEAGNPVLLYRSPRISITMLRTNSNHVPTPEETRIETNAETRFISGSSAPANPINVELRPISRSSSSNNSDRIVLEHIPRAPLRIINGPTAITTSSSSNSTSSNLSATRDRVLGDDDVAGIAVVRILFNMATGDPPLSGLSTAGMAWVRAQSSDFGYFNFLGCESTTSSVDQLLSSGASNPAIPQVPTRTTSTRVDTPIDNRVPEPQRIIQHPPRPTAPVPGTRSGNPSTTSSSQPDSTNSYFHPTTGTSLPNLPRLFHDWLTNPVTHAQAIGAIGQCPNAQVRSHALRYIELTEGIRESRQELRELEDIAEETDRLMGAMEWDRRTCATALLELHAETELFPHVIPPQRPLHSRISDDVNPSPSPHRDHTPSPPDGSAGVAFTSGMGNSLRVPQSRLRHDQSDDDVAGYHGDRSAATSAQAIYGSTTQGQQSSSRPRGRTPGSKCWRCGSRRHWHKQCPGKKHRKSRSRAREIDAEIEELLHSVRTRT